MKVCAMCNYECDDEVLKCPECGSEDFSFKCYNCGEVFDSGFCPSCGVEAGNKGKHCPECDKQYFGRSCPDCGYREIAEGAKKKYTVSAENLAKANGTEIGDDNTAEAKLLTKANVSPEALALAEMAMHSEKGKPLDFSAFAPTVSDRKRSTALILCIFLGWIGAHWFYVGNSKKGKLYFITMGLFGVGVVLDLITIINGDFKDYKGLPLS